MQFKIEIKTKTGKWATIFSFSDRRLAIDEFNKQNGCLDAYVGIENTKTELRLVRSSNNICILAEKTITTFDLYENVIRYAEEESLI